MNRNSHFLLGVIIILVGLFFLARNLGWIPYHFFHFRLSQWWPVILIAVGAWFLFGKRRG